MRLFAAWLCVSALAMFSESPLTAATSAAKGRASAFHSLCLLNPGDGQALLPGYTVGDFIRKGKASGRIKTVVESRSGSSYILRFLLVDQLSLKVTAVSLQFGEVATRPNCNGRRAAALEGASLNFERLNAGNAMIGALSVMYTVIQEELNESVSKPKEEKRPAPARTGRYAEVPMSDLTGTWVNIAEECGDARDSIDLSPDGQYRTPWTAGSWSVEGDALLLSQSKATVRVPFSLSVGQLLLSYQDGPLTYRRCR